MFTNTWHANQSMYWDRFVKQLQPKTYLEVGSYEGQSAKWVLDTFPACNVTCIDTWDGVGQGKADDNYVDIETRYKDNMKEYGDRVTTIKDFSFNALKRLDGEFDLIYIDGSHLSKHVLEDAVLSFHLLRVGGVLIFDDYGWNGYAEGWKVPKAAIDAFLSVRREDVRVLHSGWQVILQKSSI